MTFCHDGLVHCPAKGQASAYQYPDMMLQQSRTENWLQLQTRKS
jgi:hypothetical protein